MKRIEIAIGIFLLMSGTTVWAQTDSTKGAAIALQSIEQAKADLQKAELRQLDLENLVASLQASPVRPQITVQTPPTPKINFPFSSGQNRITIYSDSRTSDPLAALQIAPGTWWNNAETASAIGLSRDQQKKMDDIFQQYRLKLIDLNASLSKEEAILEPLMAADKLDEPKIVTQIDRIAQARAELEKANSRMLLGIRQSLTMEQWTKLQDPANARFRRR